MKLVKQKHVNGCGVACVAMIAGISYDKALPYVHPNREKRGNTSTSVEKMRKSLFNLDIPYLETWRVPTNKKGKGLKYDPIKLSSIKNIAILIVDFGENFHAVIWDPFTKTILDPEPEPLDLKFSFFEKNLKGYIEVKP